MNEVNNPTIEAQMLIRKPVSQVFEAFIDPSVTTNFWFTKSSGILEEGSTIQWAWEMYGVSADLKVNKIDPNKLISIEWGDPSTTVDFIFTEISKNATYVIIKNYGFDLSGEALLATIKDGTGGFTIVLAGAKAYLEHGIHLNLIGDKYPKEVAEHGK